VDEKHSQTCPALRLLPVNLENTKRGGISAMKSTVFVRPNLKLISLAAILIAVIHNLILSGYSEVTALHVAARQRGSNADLDQEIARLRDKARVKPSADLYLQISYCYEKQRNFKQAVRYLRRAEKVGSMQGDED